MLIEHVPYETEQGADSSLRVRAFYTETKISKELDHQGYYYSAIWKQLFGPIRSLFCLVQPQCNARQMNRNVGVGISAVILTINAQPMVLVLLLSPFAF